MELATETGSTPSSEDMVAVEALLSGSDEPVGIDVDVDLTVPDDLTEPPSPVVKADDVSGADDGEVIEMLAGDDPRGVVDLSEAGFNAKAPAEPSAPRVRSASTGSRKDRVTAFSDKIALDRAKELLGDMHDEVIAGMGSAPVKVGEKVYNVLCYLAGRGRLSKFTSIAMNHLRDSASVTCAELVGKFTAAGYSIATARSQAQQQMTALPILKLALRDKDKLDLFNGPMLELLDNAGKAPDETPDEELLAAETPEEKVDSPSELSASGEGSTDAPVTEVELEPSPASTPKKKRAKKAR